MFMAQDLSQLKGAIQRFCLPYTQAATDPLLARIMDEECCAAWRRTRIRVDTGALRDALTNLRSPDRRTTIRRGELIVAIHHPALGAHPEYVPRIDFGRAFASAFERYVTQRRGG